MLERTPATFRALLAGLPESWIATDEGPRTFSPFDNVGHLIHGERTDWIPRARIILARAGDRRFQPYDRFMGGYQQLVRGEIMRGRFRRSFAAPAPFEPHQVTDVDFRLQDVLHTFKKGHRIMVQVLP